MREPTHAGDKMNAMRAILAGTGGEWLEFTGFHEVRFAHAHQEVAGVLEWAEAAAKAGSWVAGFISYEAARAFDPALTAIRGRFPLAGFANFTDATPVPPPIAPAAAFEFQTEGYREKVVQALEHIGAGDIYQLNLTFEAQPNMTAADSQLMAQARYGGLLEFEGTSVFSGSPELFFRLQGDEILCQPMKGTRPRGQYEEVGYRLLHELQTSEKDRAENLMIVDMVRNDLGRIAVPGSVKTENLFELQRYPTVWQMISTVKARTHATIPQIFQALFPSASITGAPKVMAMRLIAELESRARGLYTGSIGWIAPGGRDAQFNVAIRTLISSEEASSYGVGSGIVWDSEPETELQECYDKLRAATEQPSSTLFETLYWSREEGFRNLDLHFKRLRFSGELLGLPSWDPVPELEQLSADWTQPMRVKLTLKQNGGEVDAEPFEEETNTSVGVQKLVQPIPSVYHKTTDRSIYDSALASHPGCRDVILINARGEVTEACRANVLVRQAGQLWTPPLACGLLPGIGRQVLVTTGKVSEKILCESDLFNNDGLYLVSSLRGVTEVRLSKC